MKKRVASLRSGFTLIELLVVIVIIAILAGILLPVMSRVREQGDSTKCLANLRQIGTAIVSYTSDHDDYLPGPLTREQVPTFKASDSGSLPKLLAPYLGLREDTTSGSKASLQGNVFACPSYIREAAKTPGIAVYAMNMRQIQELGQAPWGDASGGKEPLKKSVLSNWTENTSEGADRPVNLASVPAMKDTDKLDVDEGQSGGAAGGGTPLAAAPFHRDHRNTLFYDFHVEKVKTTEKDD